MSRHASQANISPSGEPKDSVAATIHSATQHSPTNEGHAMDDSHSYTARRFISDATAATGRNVRGKQHDQSAATVSTRLEPVHRQTASTNARDDADMLDAMMDTDLLQTGQHGKLAKVHGSSITRKGSVGQATIRLATRKRHQAAKPRQRASSAVDSDGTEVSDQDSPTGQQARGRSASAADRFGRPGIRTRANLQVSTARDPGELESAPPTRRSTDSSNRRSP